MALPLAVAAARAGILHELQSSSRASPGIVFSPQAEASRNLHMSQALPGSGSRRSRAQSWRSPRHSLSSSAACKQPAMHVRRALAVAWLLVLCAPPLARAADGCGTVWGVDGTPEDLTPYCT